MKFPASIFCLLFSANVVFFGSCIEDEPNFETARWKGAIENFKTGLKIKNDKGELVELTLGRSSPTEARAPLEDEVQFYLYTKKNANTPQRLRRNVGSLQLSNYDANKETFFITHGYFNSMNSESCTLIRDAYLRNTDSNVIVVDWSPISIAFYLWTAYQVKSVGNEVAVMIQYLQGAGYLTFSRTTLIGHSLGAHVMGIAGHYTHGQIQNIIGLDPALPLFAFVPPGEGISDQDAKYVQIIHTNAGLLGAIEALGHADFFINGGTSQPGCIVDLLGTCSHNRAYILFAESINKHRGYLALECNSLSEFMIDTCLGPQIARLGGIGPYIKHEGIFFLETNEEPPYEVTNPILTYLVRIPRSIGNSLPVKKIGQKPNPGTTWKFLTDQLN